MRTRRFVVSQLLDKFQSFLSVRDKKAFFDVSTGDFSSNNRLANKNRNAISCCHNWKENRCKCFSLNFLGYNVQQVHASFQWLHNHIYKIELALVQG